MQTTLLWNFVVKNDLSWDKYGEYPSTLQEMTQPHRVAMLTEYFVTEVENGGIRQWFGNPTGDYCDALISSLVCIGAEKAACLVKDFLKLIPNYRQLRKDERVAAVLHFTSVENDLEDCITNNILSEIPNIYAFAEEWLHRNATDWKERE